MQLWHFENVQYWLNVSIVHFYFLLKIKPGVSIESPCLNHTLSKNSLIVIDRLLREIMVDYLPKIININWLTIWINLWFPVLFKIYLCNRVTEEVAAPKLQLTVFISIWERETSWSSLFISSMKSFRRMLIEIGFKWFNNIFKMIRLEN